MDLWKLEADLREFDEQYRQWNKSIHRAAKEAGYKLGGPDDAATERALRQIYQEHLAIYNPRMAIRPVLEAVFDAYVSVSAEERSAIREIFGKYYHANGMLLSYMVECAECLETPEDEDAFRLALVAASIQNYASDFRDTDMILAEVAIAAVRAGINIEPHCIAIAELCSDVPSGGGRFMKQELSQFHIYAPNAVRLVPDEWLND
jgi:uncharacterized tellurite resistance protein B-like protein